jgi:hypothetical protein
VVEWKADSMVAGMEKMLALQKVGQRVKWKVDNEVELKELMKVC